MRQILGFLLLTFSLISLNSYGFASCKSAALALFNTHPATHIQLRETQVPIVDSSTLPQALNYLYAEGCTEVIMEASIVRMPLFSFLQPYVLVKLVGVKEGASYVKSFAFKTRKFRHDGTLAEIYAARGQQETQRFSDVVTVNSRDRFGTILFKLMPILDAPPVLATEQSDPGFTLGSPTE